MRLNLGWVVFPLELYHRVICLSVRTMNKS